MAWVSVHQQIRDHRKTRELYRMLKISRAEAIGTLVLIWTWAIDNCDQEGKLICCTIEDISDAAFWSKKPRILYEALIKTRWLDVLDGDIYLHDWSDFNKPFYDYLAKKKKNNIRQQEWRNKQQSQGQSLNGHNDNNSDRNSDNERDKGSNIIRDVTPSPSPSPSPSPKKESLCQRNKFLDEAIEVVIAKELYSSMKENNPKCKEPNFQKWACNIDSMIRIDNRDVEDIRKIINFSQHDNFWKSNILSTTKLREKFDQLILKVSDVPQTHEEHKNKKEIWT